ncbi:MAG: hypothetical protein ACOX17_00960 [Christensenellales bacterium]
MKKLISLLLLFFILFTGCAPKGPDGGSPKVTMPEIIDLLCEGVEVPAYEATPLTDEDFAYFAFIPYAEGLSGYQADALINAIPHSLVLIHSENGDTAELARKMLAGADPRKWICVSAEAARAAYTEHYVLLVMSSSEVVEGIMANFETAANDGEATALDASAAG